MATKDQTTEATEESPYAKDGDKIRGSGKPVGPEHDGSFSAPDFYDPETGKRIETPWDSDAQKNDPGFDPKVMKGTVEQEDAADQGKRLAGNKGGSASSGQGEGGASGGEGGEHSTKRSDK